MNVRNMVASLSIIVGFTFFTLTTFCMKGEPASTDQSSPTPQRIWTKEETEFGMSRYAYKRLSGKEGTHSNVLNSLTNGPVLRRYDEVSSAVDVVVAELDLDPSITNHILICYSNTPSSLGYLRVQCVKALIKHNREKGDDLAKVFLSGPTTSLNDKLCLLPHIVDEKYLHLYPLCLEGLKSSSRFDQEMAKRALEKYEKFDGMVCNTNGDRIDIAKAKRAD